MGGIGAAGARVLATHYFTLTIGRMGYSGEAHALLFMKGINKDISLYSL